MCKGKKSCRACARMSKAKVAGRMNKKSTSRMIKKGLYVAGGLAAAGVLSRIPAIQANNALRVVAPLGGALIAAKFLGAKGEDLAGAMIGAGLINAVAIFQPNIAAQAGVSAIGGPAYKSLHVPGVAGLRGVADRSQVEIRMQ